jgi:hypothetical protein
VSGKNAQEQRLRFVPDKEWQERLAAQIQNRIRHNENLLIQIQRVHNSGSLA